MAAHLRHRIALAQHEAVRPGAVECRDRGQRHIRQWQLEACQCAPQLGLEANFVDEVVGVAGAIGIDVDLVEHVVAEVEVVRSRARLLPRNDVEYEHDLAGIGPTAKHVEIGVVCRRIVGDQRSLAMTCGERVSRKQCGAAETGADDNARNALHTFLPQKENQPIPATATIGYCTGPCARPACAASIHCARRPRDLTHANLSK